VYLLSLPESASLPSAGGFAEYFFFWALGKASVLGKEGFAECQIKNTRQRSFFAECPKKHSAKASLPSAKVKHSTKLFFKPRFGALNEFK
jgi:hypothetical protein